MLNLKTRQDSYIARLHNVPVGAKCIHTGITMCKGRRVRSKGEHDQGLSFTHYGHHAKLQGGREAIFAGNDLVEVLK